MKHIVLVLLLASCTTYRGVVTSKGCCPMHMELKVKVNQDWGVRPGNVLEWFDSLNVGDSALIDRSTLRIIKKI